MSYLLLVEKEIQNVKLIIKLRQSELVDKLNILSQNEFDISINRFYCFSDKDISDHLSNLESELNLLLKNVNINEVYGC